MNTTEADLDMEETTLFWARITEQMCDCEDVEAMIPSILNQLCEFLGFGCGFVYKADHMGDLALSELITRFPNNQMPAFISLRSEPGVSIAQALMSERRVSFRNPEMGRDTLETQLAELFGIRCLDMVPVFDKRYGLVAMLGIADRRGRIRVERENPTFTHSILCSLAIYVRAGIYRDRVDAAQKSLISIMDNTGLDIYVNDYYTHEMLYVNQSMAAPYGGVDGMLGKRCWEVLYEGQTGECDYCPKDRLLDKQGRPAQVYAWDYQRPFDGRWFRVLNGAFEWVDGRMAHVVSSIDISEYKANEEVIRWMAEYDQLTGLPNRHKLTKDSERIIERGPEGLYVIFFDLDGFKRVNDTLGHEEGDRLLKQIGSAFQQNPLTRDRTYRYGGDEFVILCEGGEDMLKRVLDFFEGDAKRLWTLEGTDARCTASVGITRYPTDGRTASELIRNADHAMYISKGRGKGLCYCYNEGNLCPVDVYLP